MITFVKQGNKCAGSCAKNESASPYGDRKTRHFALFPLRYSECHQCVTKDFAEPGRRPAERTGDVALGFSDRIWFGEYAKAKYSIQLFSVAFQKGMSLHPAYPPSQPEQGIRAPE